MDDPQSKSFLRGIICVEELEVDLTLHRVRVANQDVRLGKKERALLELLVRNANQTLTHQQLLTEIWGDRYGDESKYLLHMLVKRVREKLGDIPPRYIVAQADIGYRFAAPDRLSHVSDSNTVLAILSTRSYTSAPNYTNLQSPPTSFVGRDRERLQLHLLFQQPSVRLVTLTGPGGIGKTRLALEVAKGLIDAFPNGVVFVPLVGLTSGQMVIWAIAQALQVKEQSDQPIEETLKTVLRDKCLLLVLDNFEHVRAAGPHLADLLASAPLVKALVTSRVLLHISGEYEYLVPPLELPKRHHDQLSPYDLAAFSAIALFVERARAAHHGFQLTIENALAIKAICMQLDGLPLAIELITVRMKFFAPQAILARLQQSALTLLTGGPLDLPDRHQTLRASLAWSYDLLAPSEQMLFARVGIFADGWRSAAAEVVCNLHGDLNVLDGLLTLVDQNLIYLSQEPDGEPRFFLLETIREYALERLAACGEWEEVEQKYATYYVMLVEQAEQELATNMQWGHLLEREYNHICATLEWSITHDQHTIGMRITGALWRFWYMRGNITEGRQWSGQVLDDTEAIPREVRAKAFDGAGILAMAQGQYLEAQHYHQRALELYRELDSPKGISSNLESLGVVRLYLRDYERALTIYEEVLAIRRAMHDLDGLTVSLGNLGSVATLQSNYQKAQAYTEEALNLSRKIGSTQRTIILLSNLAAIAYHQKQFDHALQLYQESLRTNDQLENRDGIILCLEGVALILAAIPEFERAAMLLGVVASLRESSGLFAYNSSHDLLIQMIDKGRQQLGEAWERHWNEGRAMALDQIVSIVLSIIPSPS